MIECRIGYNVCWQCLELFFVEKDNFTGKTKIAKPIELVNYNPEETVEPTVRIQDKGIQILMDALWKSGFRPTDTAGVNSVVQAKNEHIEDLRQVTFILLGKENVKTS